MHAFRAAHGARDARKKLDLRDESGDRIIAGRRASARTLVTEAIMRREIGLDLEKLLNTIQLASSLDLSEHPEVQSSILNFGIPDIVHRSIDEFAVDDIAFELAVALKRFEPRIVPRSIQVRRDMSVSTVELKVRFQISAEISMRPENVPVEFVADIEVASGKIVVGHV
ncbi:type VI secretion system baseplate subunit TssE [Prosthecomicrobium sp. N25]|uniref:type VI secretion system baseplate subunit TssE n=1 Tax=Prosthecomicrobium sp. N25 TaxID=3129254 RepID=UPI003077FB3B